MRLSLICTALFLICGDIYSQDFKALALDEFKKEHYKEAITLLERAIQEDPEDPEVWYYLGFFTHYNAYDSRPVAGYDYSYSEKVYSYLEKALELDPDYGDAKYFYGAECSANAFISMYERSAEKLKFFYKKAYDIGAYPGWLRELGRNTLDGCKADAILFTGGNATFDVCSYLQLHESYRTDVTIVPVANLDRPWYVKFLREGLPGAVRPVKINLSDYLVYDMHPYKWRKTEIDIPISNVQTEMYGLPPNYRFTILLEPDMMSDRMHSKVDSEEAVKREYLSPNRAVLMHIIEENYASRPIYFSNMADRFFFREFVPNVMDCGLVSMLMPFPVEGTNYETAKGELERLLADNALLYYSWVNENPIPRIADPIAYGYYSALRRLESIYLSEENAEGIEKIKDLLPLVMQGFND